VYRRNRRNGIIASPTIYQYAAEEEADDHHLCR